MKQIFTVLLTILLFCGISHSQAVSANNKIADGYIISLDAKGEEKEKMFESIGVFAISLSPLNLWEEVPNPAYDILAGGLQVESKKVEIVLGYASMPSKPYYKQELILGVNYLLVTEKSTRVGMGIITEFKFDENFKLPSEYTASIYQISASLGFGLKLIGNIWFYVDTYIYKVYFSRDQIYGLPFYEIDVPLLPRIVWKF